MARTNQDDVLRILRETSLRGFPNPERIGCPDITRLRQLAANEIPATDPLIEHVTQCSPCFETMVRLREEIQK